ncbi:MAG: hypothetical protein JSR99_18860 [Proteobacteria bacterium]|nr:hypothetical protein [Pseudomonadota bacterium]
MRLNSWPRICIFASVVWIWWGYSHEMEALSKAAVLLGDTNYRACAENLGKVDSFKEITCGQLRREEIATYMEQGRFKAMLEAVKPVVFTWLAVFLVIFIVSWLRGAFTSAKSD